MIPNLKTIEVTSDELRAVVERQHGGIAALREIVPVKEAINGKIVWEGVVHVFNLEGHHAASSAYAWSHALDSRKERRFYAVLGIPPIKSALDAVQAAIVSDYHNTK